MPPISILVYNIIIMGSYDLGVTSGCGQCPGTGFQKVGAYGAVFFLSKF